MTHTWGGSSKGTILAHYSGRGGRAFAKFLVAATVVAAVLMVVGPRGGSLVALGAAVVCVAVLLTRGFTDTAEVTVDSAGIHARNRTGLANVDWDEIASVKAVRRSLPMVVSVDGRRVGLDALRHEPGAATELERQHTRHTRGGTPPGWAGRSTNAWLPADLVGRLVGMLAVVALAFALSGSNGPAMRYPLTELRSLADQINSTRSMVCTGTGTLDSAASVNVITGRVHLDKLGPTTNLRLTPRQDDMLDPPNPRRGAWVEIECQ